MSAGVAGTTLQRDSVRALTPNARDATAAVASACHERASRRPLTALHSMHFGIARPPRRRYCIRVISSDSSRTNPTSPHSDHEVPGIAAPGSCHDLLGSSFGGTSCATPVTAAISALLMSANTSLKIWPERSARSCSRPPTTSADGADCSKYADGADGTGRVNSYYARLTASKRESGTTPQFRAHDYGLMTASDRAAPRASPGRIVPSSSAAAPGPPGHRRALQARLPGHGDDGTPAGALAPRRRGQRPRQHGAATAGRAARARSKRSVRTASSRRRASAMALSTLSEAPLMSPRARRV